MSLQVMSSPKQQLVHNAAIGVAASPVSSKLADVPASPTSTRSSLVLKRAPATTVPFASRATQQQSISAAETRDQTVDDSPTSQPTRQMSTDSFTSPRSMELERRLEAAHCNHSAFLHKVIKEEQDLRDHKARVTEARARGSRDIAAAFRPESPKRSSSPPQNRTLAAIESSLAQTPGQHRSLAEANRDYRARIGEARTQGRHAKALSPETRAKWHQRSQELARGRELMKQRIAKEGQEYKLQIKKARQRGREIKALDPETQVLRQHAAELHAEKVAVRGRSRASPAQRTRELSISTSVGGGSSTNTSTTSPMSIHRAIKSPSEVELQTSSPGLGSAAADLSSGAALSQGQISPAPSDLGSAESNPVRLTSAPLSQSQTSPAPSILDSTESNIVRMTSAPSSQSQTRPAPSVLGSAEPKVVRLTSAPLSQSQNGLAPFVSNPTESNFLKMKNAPLSRSQVSLAHSASHTSSVVTLRSWTCDSPGSARIEIGAGLTSASSVRNCSPSMGTRLHVGYPPQIRLDYPQMRSMVILRPPPTDTDRIPTYSTTTSPQFR